MLIAFGTAHVSVIRFWGETPPGVDWYLDILYLHGRKRMRWLHMVPFTRAVISFMQVSPPWMNFLLRISLLQTITLGVRFSKYKLGWETINIHSLALRNVLYLYKILLTYLHTYMWINDSLISFSHFTYSPTLRNLWHCLLSYIIFFLFLINWC